MFRKFLVLGFVATVLRSFSVFGMIYPCQVEVVNVTPSTCNILFDTTKKNIFSKEVLDRIAEQNYRKKLYIGKDAITIKAGIDDVVKCFYPIIECNGSTSWTLVSDGRGLFTLYIADHMDAIKKELDNVKKTVELDNMFYTDFVLQSSSDSQSAF